MTVKPSAPMMILVAGPYRSGTNDDPALISRNVQEMESYAMPIFRIGHIPILGEWLALPLLNIYTALAEIPKAEWPVRLLPGVGLVI